MNTFALNCMSGALFFTVFASTLQADEVAIPPIKDNTLYEDAAGALSNGAGRYFFAGKVGAMGSGEIRRALVAFDVAANVPDGSLITNASLRLSMTKTSSGEVPVSVHKATADWGEGTSMAAGEEGEGAAATTNDATWTKRFYNTVDWASPGGDYVASPSATLGVAGNGNYSWTSPGILADVQGWHSAPATNFGWIVVGTETAIATAKRFASRENLTSTLRPVLNITFQAPTAVREWNLY